MKSTIAIGCIALLVLSMTFSSNIAGQTPAKAEKVLLEITTEGIGMVYPRGIRLDFRLFEDQRFEYDKLANLDKPVSGPPLTRKSSKLDADEWNAILLLMADSGLLGAKARYETIRKHVDDYWFTTVRITVGATSKTITIVNFWDVF